jgi:hypothetical protein
MPNNDKRCGTCKHWLATYGAPRGKCYCFPPQIVGDDATHIAWPTTEEWDICGQFQQKEPTDE